jgi:hypothetical protein
VKDRIENITLKVKNIANNSEIVTVPEVESSSINPDYSENTENIINTQDRGTHEDFFADKDVQLSILHESVNIDAKKIGSVSNAVNPGTILQEKENMIEELKVKLEESQTAFKDLKEESQIYERILTEESDTMRSMHRELRTSNARLLSQAEYNGEQRGNTGYCQN